MEWLENNQIRVDPPKKPKRISGTRFASILGLDRWNTDFKTWCAITRTYEEPFVENKYTKAGKIIEPKIIDYLQKVYWMDIRTPEETLPPEWFECFPNSEIPKHKGNFFPKIDTFGGMWDGLYYENGGMSAVIEIKTTKRVEDWQDGAPDHYALQAALYAYLLGIDDVIMVCAFLEDKDYENPEDFVPYAGNTIIDEFAISERFPMFQAHVDRAKDWWDKHVVTGISPKYDEKKDEDILKELRKNTVEVAPDLREYILKGEKLKGEIQAVKDAIADKEKTLKEITATIRNHCMKQFRDNDTRVAIPGKQYEWVLSRSVGTEIDEKALEQDGLLEKYSKEKISYRFTQTALSAEETKEEIPVKEAKAIEQKIAGRNAYYYDPENKTYVMVKKGSPVPKETKNWNKILKKDYDKGLKEESA